VEHFRVDVFHVKHLASVESSLLHSASGDLIGSDNSHR
jgi:hypothetical protein